jgi:integrase/recombinase XerD
MRTLIPERVPAPGEVAVHVDDSALEPSESYLLTLAPSSRRAMLQALNTVADIAVPGASAATFVWSTLNYPKLIHIRSVLASRFAPSTTNKCMAAVRGTLRQAMLTDRMSHAAYTKCTAVRSVRGAATSAGRCISANDVAAMLRGCVGTTPLALRDAAMVALLYGCGLRRFEVVDIDLADYDRDGRCFKVSGKGGKERSAFLNTAAFASLERWLDARGTEPGPLFVGVTPDARVTNKRLSCQAVYRLTARVARNAKVGPASPHDFRRTFVSTLLERGADLSVVQKLVGHSSPVTTARYDRRGDVAQQRAVELLAAPIPALSQ